MDFRTFFKSKSPFSGRLWRTRSSFCFEMSSRFGVILEMLFGKKNSLKTCSTKFQENSLCGTIIFDHKLREVLKNRLRMQSHKLFSANLEKKTVFFQASSKENLLSHLIHIRYAASMSPETIVNRNKGNALPLTVQ